MTTASDAAHFLIEAHRTGRPIDRLAEPLRPRSIADAYAVQDEIMAAIGPIGGWKVGTSGPDAEPSSAPVPLSAIHRSGVTLEGAKFHGLALEIEFAFRVLRDLPRRDSAYLYDEVAAAIEFVPLIEVIGSRFQDRTALSGPEHLADANSNGAFIVGAAVADWRSIDFRKLKVDLAIDGAIVQTALDAHPLGDPARLVHWQANQSTGRTGGLKRGDIVTTGALKGMAPAKTNSRGIGDWGAAGRVEVSFR
jgi:2-keto-4-pentenoate hydratase